ncbi:MAG: hypothetical protein HXS54_13325 [Theionarchaea archaeon]|nr:hypothetical protein [Theionarchaea archaeon]
MRDKYVLDKLGIAGILFALLGLSLIGISEGQYLIRLILALMGVLFTLAISISVFKDIYYRDGTERLLTCLSEYMGIKCVLEEVGFHNELRFLRKINVDLGDTSLESLPVGPELKKRLKERNTFKCIFGFYIACLVVFLIIATTVFYSWVDSLSYSWANSLFWTPIFLIHLLIIIVIILFRK